MTTQVSSSELSSLSTKLSKIEIDPFEASIKEARSNIAEDVSSLSKMKSSPERNKRIESIVARELECIGEVFDAFKTSPKKLDTIRCELQTGLSFVIALHDYVESEKGYIRPEGELVGALKTLGGDAYLYLHLKPDELVSVANAMRSVELSKSGDKDLQGKFAPKVTGAGTANGTYFLSTAPHSLGVGTATLKQATPSRSFVLKPSRQEAGTIGNPGGYQAPVMDGVEGGEGALRERFAYAAQKHLGIDLGIPFSEIIPAKHPVMSSVMGQSIRALKALNDALGTKVEIDMTQVMSDNPHIKKVEQVLPLLFTVLEKEVSGEQEKKLAFFEGVFKAFCSDPNVRKMVLIKESRKAGLNIQENPRLLVSVNLMLGALKAEESAPPIASIQQFVPKTKVYAEYSKAEIEEIPDAEMHKIAVTDLIILNGDRHLNNMLFKDQDGTTPKLVLIDHGSSLPHPARGKNLVDAAKYEWLAYSQFDHRLDPTLAEKVLELDTEEYIENLKADQAPVVQIFGEGASISEESYMLVRLNIRLLKVGAKLGVPVRNMALFHQVMREGSKDVGGEVAKFFAVHFAGKTADQVDWSSVDEDLKEILLTPIKERLTPSL